METAPQIRKSIFKQIHEIVFHGQGGYDYKTIYSMPLWLRKFTFHEIRTFYEEKAAAEKGATKQGQTNLIDSKGKINTPQFKKASKPYERKSSYK
jgi:hypothetical protein|tara:strand:- start:58 stop:342 length:285 start_codon:yes stop_codon:yes gene_type:complete